MVSCRMARTLPLHPHLCAAELSRRARQAPNLVEARRWQLLALIADGKTVKAAAQLVGLDPPSARRVVHRSNQDGPTGVRDRRLDQTPPRRPALLTPEQQQALATALQGPAPGGGWWTGPAVAQWIAEQTGREAVAPQRGHDSVKRLRMSPQRPRPRHHDADPAAQTAFQQPCPSR
jgi:transposase